MSPGMGVITGSDPTGGQTPSPSPSIDVARVIFLHEVENYLRSPNVSPASKRREIAATVSAVTALGMAAVR